MSEETRVYAGWLRSIADAMEARGIEEGSVQTLNITGSTEVTKPENEFRNFKPTKDQFFSIAWRYENEP
jgi:hypothetical protein